MWTPGLWELQVLHTKTLGWVNSPELLCRCDKIRCDGSRLVDSFFAIVDVYFWDGKSMTIDHHF
jgi:hypothetical protein